MTIYTEYEVRCDCGGDEDKFGCEPALYGATKAQAWSDAANDSWVTHVLPGRKVKHYKPGHEPA
jgi:hypothetical protein